MVYWSYNFGPAVRQHITAAVCSRAKLLTPRSKGELRGGWIPTNSSKDMPKYLKTSHQVPPQKDSTISQKCHPGHQAFTTETSGSGRGPAYGRVFIQAVP